MKKRKARCKLKIIVRKSTPKSSRLYSLATDYKFWYVRYLNKSCCFFSNFVNVNRVIAKKLLRKSKRASKPSLNNHKTTKSSSRSCGNPFKNYARVNFTKSFHSSMTSIYAQHSLDLSSRTRDRDRYSKIAKRMKRRRQGEPSRLSVRNILRSMKKRKARCKLKIIVRKSTPKSSRLYSLATDYKFWYVRYLNKSCCFFSNFVNVNRVIAKKLLRKSKRASKPSLNNHKTTKSSSRSCGNPFKNYARVNFTKSFHSSMTSIYAQHSLDLSSRTRDRDRYSKIAKRMKRRRQGEPSRFSVKKILRFMKKRKARCKLKIIVRKSTPKFSRLYSLATYNKFWYVRYLNRSCCFFSNFVNVNRVIAKKLLRQSKRASNPSLTNRKTTKSSSCTERFCVSRMKLLTSGDIELNPGPQQGVNNQTTLSVGSTMLLSF